MLTDFIISLVAVLAFAIFEYFHNKAAYNIKTAWIKYLAGLLLGTFAFSYLLTWPVFQYVLLAAFVIAFLFFFWIIVQKLNIKGVPGQPVKVVVLILVVAGMSSCHPAPDYHNDITGRNIASIVRQGPLDAATLDSVKAGLVDTVLIHAGAVDTYNMADSIYTIEKTKAQNSEDFWSTGWRVWTAGIGILLTAGSLLAFIIATSKGGGIAWMWYVVPFAFGCVMFGGSAYPFSDEGEIPKWQYEQNLKATGDQQNFDWHHLKSY